MWFAEECRKHLGDFENGAILLSGHIFAEPGKSNWVEHALHSVHYIFETLQYDAYTFLLHPLRVVAFLRERPGVAFDQHRELADHGFSDASWAGLADQKIRCAHQPMHFFVDANNTYRHLPFARA